MILHILFAYSAYEMGGVHTERGCTYFAYFAYYFAYSAYCLPYLLYLVRCYIFAYSTFCAYFYADYIIY
jgi:hypothetical protein